MKRSVTAIAAIGTLVATPALAADMALKAPPPQPPAWSWTGCYVGIEGGGVLSHDPVVANTGAHVGTTVTTITSSDGLIGGTIGCNYQFSLFVIGIENDLSWTGSQGTASDQKPFPTAFSHSVSSTWLDTLRARAGVVFGGGGFLYATGGAAFSGIQDSATTGAGVGVSSTTTATGWTVGGGVEFMPWPNWSLKVEYLFVQFPSINDAFDTLSPVGTFVGVNTHLSENIIRAGINWHFN